MGIEPGANPALLLQQPADALRQAVPHLVSHEALSLLATTGTEFRFPARGVDFY